MWSNPQKTVDLITFTEVILTEVMPLRPLLLMPLFSNKNGDIELYKEFPFDKELNKTRNDNKNNNRRKRNWNILIITEFYMLRLPKKIFPRAYIFPRKYIQFIEPTVSYFLYVDIFWHVTHNFRLDCTE